MIAYNTASLFGHLLNLALKYKERLILQLERREQSAPDPLHNGIEKIDSVIAILEEGAVIEGGILTDPMLSDVGRRDKMTKLTESYRKRVTFLPTAAREMRAAAAKLERKLFAAPEPKLDPIPDALQMQEVRKHLRAQPVSDRLKLLIASLNAGEQHILRAVLSDPLAFSDTDRLIPAHDLERFQEQYAKAPDGGKEWNRLETLTHVAETLEQMAAAVEAQLSHYDAIPSFAPKTTTRHVDLGMTDQTAPPAKSAADQPTKSAFQ